MEPPSEGETKVCINDPDHISKMAAVPIYGKTLQKSSPEGSPMILKLKLVVYLYVNGSGSITSVGEERANLSAVVYL